MLRTRSARHVLDTELVRQLQRKKVVEIKYGWDKGVIMKNGEATVSY